MDIVSKYACYQKFIILFNYKYYVSTIKYFEKSIIMTLLLNITLHDKCI